MLKIISGRETSQHPTLMGRVHRFRHAIFVEEKGWQDLRRADGLERDWRSCTPSDLLAG